jgi:heme-degrading monooxygenase HmoA
MWRATAAPANVAAYSAFFRRHVEPALSQLEGFRGAEILTRHTDELVEIVVQTRWTSLDAVTAFAGANLDAAVVEPEAIALLIEHDPFVRHFTVAHAS